MRTTGRSDLVDVEVFIHARTEKAIRASPVGSTGSDRSVWLPLSQIEFEQRGQFLAVVTLPSWLAEEKGLV